MGDQAVYMQLVGAAWEELRNRFAIADGRLGSTIVSALVRNDFPKMAALRDYILSDEKLGPLRGGWLGHDGGAVVQTPKLIHYLVAAHRNGLPLDGSLKELSDFARAGESEQTRIVALGGIEVEGRVQLAADIALVPWADALKTSAKEDLERQVRDQNAPFDVQPSAALLYRMPSRQILFGSHAEFAAAAQAAERQKEIMEVEKTLREAVAFLPLFTLSRVHVFGRFTALSNPVAECLSFSGISYGSDRATLAAVQLKGDLASPFGKFRAFPEQSRDALRAVIRKFADATGRANNVDKAIDLGTILEMVLLHDLNERGELTYRIRVRGASFLEVGADRMAMYKTLGKIYELRSAAAHSGRIRQDAQALAILNDGVATCSALIRKLIDLGRFPEWEREYVLAAVDCA